MLRHSLHVSVLLQKLEEREEEKLHCTVPVDKVQSRDASEAHAVSPSLSVTREKRAKFHGRLCFLLLLLSFLAHKLEVGGR